MPPAFPLSALVGQDLLQRALLLGVIQPNLGGVLVRGTKGVAKSTAVRALASLLPAIETVAGCPFQRRPNEVIVDWPLPVDAALVRRPVPLVELPLGATEDRVLGTLHLERALRGERVFEPGLLAAANRGLLYIDEVNLLPDHLVDMLLDAAASGVHRVEREGLSLSHPARFLLVGTMNPEEGELRPQLLDRFGLAVDVADLTEPAERAEAVRRRLAFEADADAFAARWSAAETALAERIVRAQQLLPEVRIADDLLQAVSERCLAAHVEGLRADLTLCRAACAWASYQGRSAVEAADIDAVAELALAHRRRPTPEPPPPKKGEVGRGKGEGNGTVERSSVSSPAPGPLLQFGSAGEFTTHVRPKRQPSAAAGRGRGQTPRRGPVVGTPRSLAEEHAIAWAASVRAAAPQQTDRGRTDERARLVLHSDDLRFWRRRGPAGALLLFVVDASGSMAAWRRMRQTKAAVLALLRQAYRQRDRVALIAFRGTGAEVVLPPTRGLMTARRAVEEMRVGGATPLASGLAAAVRLVRQQCRQQPRQPFWTVILTDGRANHGTSGDPWREALEQAAVLGRCGGECLVVDTETGWPRFGRAAELAHALGVACLALEEIMDPSLRTTSTRSASGVA